MFSLKAIVLIAVALAAGAESSAVPVPTAVAASLVAPAHVGYAHAVPQNIPPYAAQINIASKALLAPAPFVSGPFAAPLAASVAAPYTIPEAAPFAAPVPAPAGLATFARLASTFYPGAPVLPGPYPYQTPITPAAYAGAYPYAAAAPFFRHPVGVPAFVR